MPKPHRLPVRWPAAHRSDAADRQQSQCARCREKAAEPGVPASARRRPARPDLRTRRASPCARPAAAHSLCQCGGKIAGDEKAQRRAQQAAQLPTAGEPGREGRGRRKAQGKDRGELTRDTQGGLQAFGQCRQYADSDVFRQPRDEGRQGQQPDASAHAFAPCETGGAPGPQARRPTMVVEHTGFRGRASVIPLEPSF